MARPNWTARATKSLHLLLPSLSLLNTGGAFRKEGGSGGFKGEKEGGGGGFKGGK